MDLYYSLFGSKIPNCLAKNELPLTSGLPKIPKIPKISDTKRSASPFDNGIVAVKTVTEEPVEIEAKEAESMSKPIEINEEPADSIKVILKIHIYFYVQIPFLKTFLQKCISPSLDGEKRCV